MAMSYQIQISVIKNQSLIQKKLNLCFQESNYHHLGGFHKLKDINYSNYQPKKLYKDMEKGIYDNKGIIESSHLLKFLNRSTALTILPIVLDYSDNYLKRIYRFDNKIAGSKIEADYLLYFEYRNESYYFFIGESKKCKGSCLPVSFFRKNIKNYQDGQHEIALNSISSFHRDRGNTQILPREY